ncbi:MAG: hypothetical protein R3E55_08420 [Burkholderiaceae bacterium]
MKYDHLLGLAISSIARIPTTLPWWIAGRLGGGQTVDQRRQLLRWLEDRFAQVFPRHRGAAPSMGASPLLMLAQEKVDAMAFNRLGRSGGPSIEMLK